MGGRALFTLSEIIRAEMSPVFLLPRLNDVSSARACVRERARDYVKCSVDNQEYLASVNARQRSDM